MGYVGFAVALGLVAGPAIGGALAQKEFYFFFCSVYEDCCDPLDAGCGTNTSGDDDVDAVMMMMQLEESGLQCEWHHHKKIGSRRESESGGRWRCSKWWRVCVAGRREMLVEWSGEPVPGRPSQLCPTAFHL
jgi:hypothetical protein